MGRSRQTANLVSNNNILVDINNNRVGISTTGPNSKLEIAGDVKVSGIVTAASFSGNGSNLTNLNASNLSSGIVPAARITNTSALNVGGDLYVSGNISFGGTTTQLNTSQLTFSDPDLVLGIGTTSTFNPTDTTANHGGIAIASTEGSPLVNLNINPAEVLPTTYKKFMWFKNNTAGLGTDAWLSNYAVGIGSTQFPTGIVFVAGNVQLDANDIKVVRNIDASGIITAVRYYGDGSQLTNILSGVGIATSGGLIGIGATILDFRGAGISTVTVSSGIGTIFVQGGGSGSISISTTAPPNPSPGDLWYSPNYARTFIYYSEASVGAGTSSFWVDSSPFNQGLVGILAGVAFTTGSAVSPSWYFAGDAQTGVFSPGLGELTIVSSGSSVLNVNASGIRVTGVSTATSFVKTGGTSSQFLKADGSVDTNTYLTSATLDQVLTAGNTSSKGLSVGLVTATSAIVGSAVTITSDGIITVGVITATDFNTTSDFNLKENITTVSNALDVVNDLRGVRFEWKKDHKPSYGVIAQELEEILPELVSDTDPKTVNYNGIIGILIEAVKELSNEVEQLKNNKY